MYVFNRMGILSVFLSLSLSVAVFADELTLKDDLKQMRDGGKALSIDSKVAVGEPSQIDFVFPLTDYYWFNSTDKLNSDLFLQYSYNDKFFHRVIASSIFNGVVHSVVGAKLARYFRRPDNYNPYAPTDSKNFFWRNDFKSGCKSESTSVFDVSQFALEFQAYPNVSVIADETPTKIYSLVSLLMDPWFADVVLDKDESGLSDLVKGYYCRDCQGKTGFDIYLGFDLRSGSAPGLKSLKFANVSILDGKVERDFMYYIHKMEVFDSPEVMRKSGNFQPHPGVFCNLSDVAVGPKKVEMKWPSHISMSSERVNSPLKRVEYVDEYYDFDAKLSRLNLRGSRLTVNVSADDVREFDNTKLIIDHNAHLAFVDEFSTDSKCEIYPMEYLKYLNYPRGERGDGLIGMQYPMDIFGFNETMTFKGYCEDSFSVAGKLYTSTAALYSEFCVLDRNDTNQWTVGNVDDNSFLLPLWLSQYSKREINSDGHEMKNRINFLDVTNKQALHDSFDISHCFKTENIDYFVLLAEKISTGPSTIDLSHDHQHEIKLCIKHVIEQNASPQCYKQQDMSDMRGFNTTYLHALSRALALALKVYPSRLSYVVLDDSNKDLVVIAFALLDFAGLSSVPQINNQAEMKNNDVIKGRIASLKQKSIEVLYSVRKIEIEGENEGGSRQDVVHKDQYKIFTFLEVSKNTYEMILNKNSMHSDSGRLMMVLMIVVACIMLVVGCVIGVGVAHKLWRTSTSFGYMIHSDVL